MPYLAFLVAIGLILFGMPLVGVVVLLLGIASLAVSTMKRAGSARQEDDIDSLDPSSRSLFVPIRRLAGEVQDLVESNRGEVVAIVGPEAVQESNRIRSEAAKALATRSRLRRLVREEAATQNAIQDLQARLTAATTDDRDALETALAARQLELTHYGPANDAIRRIDAGVEQAVAALAEMKAGMVARMAQGTAPDPENLRGAIGRLRSLSVSAEEAEQFLGTL